MLALVLMRSSGVVAFAAQHDNVITSMNYTGVNGNPINNIDVWHNFRINGTFDLSGVQNLQAGDTTVIKLPDELAFGNQAATFE